MKKVIVLIFAVLCLLTLSSVFTVFADENLKTNVVLTLEETIQASSQQQESTQPDTAITEQSNGTTSVKTSTPDSKSDSQFIKTGNIIGVMSTVIMLTTVITAVVAIWITKRNTEIKE